MSAEILQKKARDISYAILWVGWYVKRPHLRYRLESLVVDLVERVSRLGVNTALESINDASVTISSLDGLVRFGHTLYEVEPVNASIILKELSDLNSAIRQFGNSGIADKLPNLEQLFAESNRDNLVEVAVSAVNSINNGSNEAENGNSAVNSAIRQSAILNKIKYGNSSTELGRIVDSGRSGQAGFRLKDLIAEFPDVSERTLRYDLQRLCDQGLVERVGNGGPASYYRAK